jgi:hypothetical protein
LREEDSSSASNLELGHIHERLGKLESEIKEVRDGQHRMEVVMTSRPRFPAWLPTTMATILLFLVTQTLTAVWWASDVTRRVADVPALEQRLTSAFQGMRNNDTVIATIQSEHVRLRNEMDIIQRRTIEGTDDRWRKRDDEARMSELQKYLDVKFAEIDRRVHKEEERSAERDRMWSSLISKGIVKSQ